MLTTIPQNATFDLQPWVGQRSSTFQFRLINGLTGENLGTITPLRNATLTHNTEATIKRSLKIGLGAIDVATVNPLVDRVEVDMVLGDGSIWPLGRYMFTDQTNLVFTSGTLSNVVLNDEMFLVDQEIVVGYDATGKPADQAYRELLAGLPVTLVIESSSGFGMSQSWGVGTSRGAILNAIAIASDYFSPWFGNDTLMHLKRTFNPADEVPQFDWDSGNQVMREGITETSNILTAPNRFVVISNTGAQLAPVVGIATVPVTAPNSFANRGFYITNTQTLQLTDPSQAAAVANGLANRQTVFETVNLNTAVDPRHDSYDVIFWRGSFWLELAWTIQLVPGGTMSHTLRKAYAS
jgi:hypothetical protein